MGKTAEECSIRSVIVSSASMAVVLGERMKDLWHVIKTSRYLLGCDKACFEYKVSLVYVYTYTFLPVVVLLLFKTRIYPKANTHRAVRPARVLAHISF